MLTITIVDYQRVFPWGSKPTAPDDSDIAEIVQMDISTISQATSKYIQTPYGTFLLKSFFESLDRLRRW